MIDPQPERCQAILKYVYNWRCTRQESVDGLCKQHHRFGARVPVVWRHEVNEYGVDVGRPVGPVRRRAPDGS